MSSFNQHVQSQLPDTLGQKTSATSLSVVLASDYTLATTSADDHGAGASTANTLRVVVSTDSSIAASQSGTWNISNITGTVTLPTGAATAAKQPALGTAGTASADVLTVQGIVGMTALKVDGSAVTQPISAVSLPLPTGAATSAKQPAIGIAGTASADVITVQGITGMTALKVDGSAVTQPVSGTVTANQGGAWNVTDITGTVSLPTGAATETTLSALNGKVADDFGVSSGAVRVASLVGNATGAADFNTGAAGAQTLRSVLATRHETATTPLAAQLSDGAAFYKAPTSAQLPSALGQAVSASSLAVVISSDQSAVPITLNTRSSVLVYRNDNSSASITTSAYTQITASTGGTINRLYVSDTSGSAFKIATGAAASETDILYIPPGGNDAPYEINVPSGTRLSVKALDTNMSSGQLIVTGLS